MIPRIDAQGFLYVFDCQKFSIDFTRYVMQLHSSSPLQFLSNMYLFEFLYVMTSFQVQEQLDSYCQCRTVHSE